MNSIPDLTQTDPSLGLSDGGMKSWASVTATNRFGWLADKGYENMVIRDENGSVSYAKTAQLLDEVLYPLTDRGSLSPLFLGGVEHYLSGQGYAEDVYHLEYQSWLHPEGFEGISIPNINSIKKGIVGDGAVWLFVGFY